MPRARKPTSLHHLLDLTGNEDAAEDEERWSARFCNLNPRVLFVFICNLTNLIMHLYHNFYSSYNKKIIRSFGTCKYGDIASKSTSLFASPRAPQSI